MEFTRDFRADFYLAVSGLVHDYQGPPYCFVRFADGESAILRGEPFRAKSDNWSVDRPLPKLHQALWDSLRCQEPGWHLGITARSHHPEDHTFLMWNVDLPLERVSFAELFIFDNYRRFSTIDTSRFRVVGYGASGRLGFNIPPDAVADPEFDVRPIVDWMRADDSPVLLAAGPLSNWIGHAYWMSDPPARCVCLDVGSALSPRLRGRKTRRYQHRGSPLSTMIPAWG